MDDIFEQMLSAPSWGDGALAMDPVRIDSTQRTQQAAPLPSPGATDNQRLLLHAASQARQELGFDSHLQLGKAGHEIRASCRGSPAAAAAAAAAVNDVALVEPHGQSLWTEPFSHDSNIPPLASNVPGHFPQSREGMLNNLHLGKRGRVEEDTVSTDVIPGDISPHGHGDQMLFAPHSTENGPLRPRVRARRGQATDPHSIAERKRRERIAERMKALQELVPDSNKTDKASMLDEIISYVKFLQMQVKCLSMCRLGGAGAAAPLLADFPAQGAANFIAANLTQANVAAGSSSKDGLAFTEHQVAQLMDEDMSAAMQFLQSKGLCLMPISLATAFSSTEAKHPTSSAKHSNVHEQFPLGMQSGALAALANSGLNTNNHLAKLKITEDTTRDESDSDET